MKVLLVLYLKIILNIVLRFIHIVKFSFYKTKRETRSVMHENFNFQFLIYFNFQFLIYFNLHYLHFVLIIQVIQ